MTAKLAPMPFVALLVTALSIAGCGSSDDSTLSRAEFLKQVDAICWKAHNKSFDGLQEYIKKHPEDFSSSASPVAARTALGNGVVVITVPAIEQGTEELEALAAPQGESQKVQKFVAAIENANRAIEEDPQSRRVTSGAVYDSPNGLARKYDFGRCGQLP
ncbi:MAG: hypothetical protein WA862_09320 [Solirubrobacterales bacterium]